MQAMQTCPANLPFTIIGIGSPHGDDRAGWAVADTIESLLTADPDTLRRLLDIRKATVPHQILDWLAVDSEVHLVDASLDDDARVRRIAIGAADLHRSPPIALKTQRSESTHHMDVLETLKLAAALGRFPNELILWTISITEYRRASEMSQPVELLVQRCAQQMIDEIVGRN